ncbi:MAG: DUF4339 domain-containing protein, partial [Elusimicrobia bacterium]|nr:DUF4339 domain-containing protein [Elusimicrobiota bacterium]
MMPRYWIRINRQTYGPFTAAQLRKIPEVDEDTFVSPEGASSEEDWTRLRDCAQLLEIMRSRPQPASPSDPAPAAAPPGASPGSGRDRCPLVALALAALTLPWAILEALTVWRLMDLGGGRLWRVHGAAMLLLPALAAGLALASKRRAAAAEDEEGAHAASLALLTACLVLLGSGLWITPRFARARPSG